jgi:hypothetical protein
LTAAAFDKIGVPYSIVVQPREAREYRSIGLNGRMLLLPDGLDGLVPTRNWIWDHAAALGVERYWTFDDNIRGLYRLNRNLKVPVGDGSTMRAIEHFVGRFENVPIAGMNYFMFAPRKAAVPPLVLNARVYSNMLIQTDARDGFGRPLRNVGVYNDDTDLCLRVLKMGYCTILFNAFLIYKMTTMTVKGGMTPQYGSDGEKDGRWAMARELQMRHPDVVTITRKWGRWQHQVDYRPFRDNRLIPRLGAGIARFEGEMVLEQRGEDGIHRRVDQGARKNPGG